MKNIHFRLLFVFFLAVFLFFVQSPIKKAVAEGFWSDIKINEVYPNSDKDKIGDSEWVELYNSGMSSFDLSGGKIYDSRIKDYKQINGVISAGGWLVVTSSSYLNNNGDAVVLKDPAGITVDDVAYGTNSSSSIFGLEGWKKSYKGLSFGRWPDGGNEWVVFETTTIGSANSFSGDSEDEENSPDSETEESEDAGVATSSTDIAFDAELWSRIKINEFVSVPEEGGEWVELYNPTTSSLDLVGGLICDSTDKNCKAVDGAISAGGWLTVEWSASYLNNSGDSVVLKNPDGQAVEQIDYGDSLEAPSKGTSLARRVDGVGGGSAADWAVTLKLTKGSANIIQEKTADTGNREIYDFDETKKGGGSPPKWPEFFQVGEVLLNEIYPDMKDNGEGFVEIKNFSDFAVKLDDWKLISLNGQYDLSGSVMPGEIVVFELSTTGLIFNADEETVGLLGADGKTVDEISYKKAKEKASYNRVEGGWDWSVKTTKGRENIIREPAVVADSVKKEKETGGGEKDIPSVFWRINAPVQAERGESVLFDAKDSADPLGGELSFGWDFGDGEILKGAEVSYVFSRDGDHKITISASSSLGTIGQTDLNILIGSDLPTFSDGVFISEIYPNPIGGDDGEFIELYNASSTEVDLEGYSLKFREDVYTFFPRTKIASRGFLVFKKQATGFSLTNTGGTVEFYAPDGKRLQSVNYGQSKEGESYNIDGGQSFWSDKPNSGSFPCQEEKQIGVVSKAAAKPIVKTTAAKPIYRVDLADVWQMEKGAKVVARGVVTVLPGVFGSQYFYISSEGAGIQVYMYSKDFPSLRRGDLIEINGEVSDAYGSKRIKVKNKADIGILATGQEIEPIETDIEQAGNFLGGLIKIKGMVTELKSSYMYVDDGLGEIAVYFKKNSGINKNDFAEGSQVEVLGVLETDGEVFKLLPRDREDVQFEGEPDNAFWSEAVSTQGSNENSAAEKYLTATTGGLTALILGFIVKARGGFALVVLKKGAKMAVGLIKKG